MNLVDRGEVYLWVTAASNLRTGYDITEPDWFKVSRNFKKGSEQFPEWKKFRTRMEEVRDGLDALRGFMT